jgi:penicillin amidase
MRSAPTVVAVVLASVVLGAPSDAVARPSAADPPQELAGLQHPVRVVRDRSGVPHVYAGSDHDAFFVNGYVQAQDRFFEMDDSRRQAEGTRSELLGPGPGDEVLSSDVFLRTLGLRRAAERSAGSRDPTAAATRARTRWRVLHRGPDERATRPDTRDALASGAPSA